MLDRKAKVKLTISVLIIALPLLILLALRVGYSDLSYQEIVQILLGRGESTQRLILMSFRMPRIMIALLVGAAFAVSGCILQGLTKNPLADPAIMGVNAGGGLIVVLFMIGVGTLDFHSIFVMPIFSFVGSMVVVGLIYTLSQSKYKGMNPNRFILNGIALNAGINGLMMILVLKMDQDQHDFLARWQAGSIWGAHWDLVIAVLPWIVIGIGLAIIFSHQLDLLLLGDATSMTLGLNVKRAKRILLIIAASLAASAVSVSGSIAFVGLMAPHISRKLVGNRQMNLVITSALVGAILVLFADIIARFIVKPAELPTGIVVSIIGAPYFIYLLFKSK